MKKYIGCFISLLCFGKLSAQNVGIGTPTPIMPMHISAASDTAQLLLENRATLAIGTNLGLYLRNGNYYTAAIKSIGTASNAARLSFFTYADGVRNNLKERLTILDNGNIGINTVDPKATLDINGPLRYTPGGQAAGKVMTSDAAGIVSWQNATLTLPYRTISAVNDTLFRIAALGTASRPASFIIDNAANALDAVTITTNGSGRGLFVVNEGHGADAAAIFGSYQSDGGAAIRLYSQGGPAINALIDESPNIIECRRTAGFGPTEMIARIDRNGKGFFNGGTQTGGADVAEAFDVEGDRNTYEPGDVLVISTSNDRTIGKSNSAYSRLVVGVYATKPGVLLTEYGSDDNIDHMVPMGVVGVIPTKVCSEGGVIHRGDLLVTSSTTGHAMKANDDQLKFGMIIGKALEDFVSEGSGKINVMVNIK